MKQQTGKQVRSVIFALFLGMTTISVLLILMMELGGQPAPAAAAPASPTASVIYVDIDATGANDGTSWANAYPNLQDALAAATTNSEFWVAEGVYYPDVGGGQSNNDRSATFTLKGNNLEFYGGFAGTETRRSQRDWRANVTILSGDIDQNDIHTNGIVTDPADINGNNAYHVVTLQGVTLDGFNLTAGQANGSGEDALGGGIFATGGNKLRNLTFSGNTAAQGGGGLYQFGGINNELTNVTFTANSATQGGAYHLKSDKFVLAFAGVDLNNVLFSGNSADQGGGMYNHQSFPNLYNVTFSGNSATSGGGMFNEGSESDVKINNSIFWNNRDSSGTGAAGASIHNANNPIVDISYSLVQGSGGSGAWNSSVGTDMGHNLDVNPQFVTLLDPTTAPAAGGDFHLQTGSPAINGGNNSQVLTAADLDGNPRLVSTVDMGAYEEQGSYQNGVIYVDKDAACLPCTGLDWNNAFTTVQDALTAAGAGVEIWVAKGAYYPDDGDGQSNDARDSTFSLKPRVSMYGGFAGNETLRSQRNWTTNITVLSGDIDHETNPDLTDPNGVVTDTDRISGSNAFHVATALPGTHPSVLDGFTISAGKADRHPTDEKDQTDKGGGIILTRVAMTFTNISFSGNLARGGGGMYNVKGSSPNLTNVTFTANTADAADQRKIGGGGMFNDVRSSPQLTNVTFRNNETRKDGGGMYNFGNSNPILTNVSFTGNLARDGAGMANEESSPSLNNVLFSGNVTIGAGNGAGMVNRITSSPSLVNVTFSGNKSDGDGGGMYNVDNSNPVIDNTIFWDNTALGDITQPYQNSISNSRFSIPTIRYSLVQGSGSSSAWVAGVGKDGGSNIDTDPLFVMLVDSTNITTTRAALVDLRLQPGSPAADAGDNSLLPADLTTDLDGNPRIINGIVDMGPYESVVACPPQGTTTMHVQQGGTGLSGATWSDALGSLQDALSLAAGCGGVHEIWVAAGVYYPDVGATQSNNDRTLSFQLLNGVGVYGGFNGHETSRIQRNWRSNLTVLSGDIDGNDSVDADGIITNAASLNGANSYHVVSGNGTNSSATIDGFTITAGHAAGPAASNHNAGGGLLNNSGSPTLAHLDIKGNAAEDGGGMANLDSSHPTLTNIIFSANIATLFGGGLYNSDSHPTLTNVALSGNAAFSGGGIFNHNSQPQLTNLTVTGNQAVTGLTVNGLMQPTSIATVPTGGGMFNNDSSKPQIRNSIFWNNKDSSGTGTVTATIHNADFGSISGYEYSLIQSSGGSGAWNSVFGFDNGHNIDADPLFRTAVDPAVAPTGGGDLELTHNSPAIDTAFNSYNSSDTDLAGDPRRVDGTGDGRSLIDMGAYEFLHLEVVKTTSKTSAQVGETITYSYWITNTSNITIDNLTATDDKLGPVSLGTTTLAAGAGTSGMLTYTIEDTDPNPLINTVTVTGTTPTAVEVGGSASASVALPEPPPKPGNPAIAAKVTADKTSAAVGETITYSYLITNTGDEVLNNILANDSFGWINLGKSTLAPAESTSVDVKHTVTPADLPSPLVNTLTVKGSPPVGDDVTAQDQVQVVVNQPKVIYLPVILKQGRP